MEKRRRDLPEHFPPHWSPVMALAVLVTLGAVVAVLR